MKSLGGVKDLKEVTQMTAFGETRTTTHTHTRVQMSASHQSISGGGRL